MESFLNTEVHLLPEEQQGAAGPPASAPAASQQPLQPQTHTHITSGLTNSVPQLQPQRLGPDQPMWSAQAPASAAFSSQVSAGSQQPFQQPYAPFTASLAQPEASPVFRPGPLLPGPVRQQQVMVNSLQGPLQQGPVSQQGLQSGMPNYGGQRHSGGQQAYQGPKFSQNSKFTGLMARPATGQQGLLGQEGMQPGYLQYNPQGTSGGHNSMQQAYMPASSSGQLELRPAGQAGFQAGILNHGAGMAVLLILLLMPCSLLEG